MFYKYAQLNIKPYSRLKTNWKTPPNLGQFIFKSDIRRYKSHPEANHGDVIIYKFNMPDAPSATIKVDKARSKPNKVMIKARFEGSLSKWDFEIDLPLLN